MAYAMRPDGLADVHLGDGSVMPMALSPEQLEAMGHAPIAPGALPAMPDLRFAGPGAAAPPPDDLADIRAVAGQGVPAGSLSSDQFRGALGVRAGERGAHASEPAGALPPGMRLRGGDAGEGPPIDSSGAIHPSELAQHAEPRGGASAEGGGGPSEGAQLAFRQATGAGGGPVREQQYLKDRKEKYELPGTVDPALAADIGRREADLDESAQTNLSEHHYQASRALNDQRAALEQQQRDIRDQRAQREQVNARLADLAQKRDAREAEAANVKAPDMADYWKSKGTISNIMTGLSIALGGYLQGMHGGANPGLEMSNQAIERWIDQQKEDYTRLKGRATDASNQYKQALDLYGTPELADLDMRSRAYAVRDSMLKNQIDQIGTEDAFAQGSQLLQENQLQRQQLKAQAMSKLGERAVEDTISTRLTGGGAGGNSYLKGLRAAAEATKLEKEINGDTGKGAETRVKLPDGSEGYAANASEAAKLRDQAEGAADVRELSRALKRDVESMGDRTDPKTRGKILARIPALKIAIAKQHGIPLRGAQELLDAQLGNPEDLVNIRTNPGARLDAIAAEADHKINVIKSHRLSARPGSSAAAGDETAPASTEREEEE